MKEKKFKDVKVVRSVRISPNHLSEVEKYNEISNGEINLSTVITAGIKKELAELKKIYGR